MSVGTIIAIGWPLVLFAVGLIWTNRRLRKAQLPSNSKSDDAPRRPEDIYKLLVSSDTDYLNTALAICLAAFEDEEKRGQAVEAKGMSLIAATGLTTSVSIVASGTVLAQSTHLPQWLVTLFAAALVGLLGCIGWTMWRKVQVVQVRFSMRPKSSRVLELQDQPDIELIKHRVADLLASYEFNADGNDWKVGYLREAQTTFLWAVLLLIANAALVITVLVLYGFQIIKLP